MVFGILELLTMIQNVESLIEAILFTAGEPVPLERLRELILDEITAATPLSLPQLKIILATLTEQYQNRGIELKEVASGYRFQAKAEFTPWLQKLHARKSVRYSRAFLETLALVVYRQPLTRGEIEEIRGVAVSTQIIKSLLELEWIRVLGQRDVPGKPALYGSTKKFLDDFNLTSLSELPPLQEAKNLAQLEQNLVEQLQLEIFDPAAQVEVIC
jgi:segregation and condensation protein B